MKNVFKSIIPCLLSIVLLVTASSSAAASEKFSTAHDLTYKIHADGNTTVTHNFHLTNLTSEFFAEKYTIIVNSQSITNFKAFDKFGILDSTTTEKGAKKIITVNFPEMSVGLGKTLDWSLVYDTDGIAQNIGRIWQVNISTKDISDHPDVYSVTLIPPPNFGPPIYQKPFSTTVNNWNNLNQGGISAAYIKSNRLDKLPYQAFQFELHYHLKNPQLRKSTVKIALPPDTEYQKVFLQSILPKPTLVELDADENWLANFEIPAFAQQEVIVRGQAAVFSQPQFKNKSLKLQQYLKPTRFWQSTHPEITKLAKIYNTPEKIFNYIVNTLTYDSSRITSKSSRAGATVALTNPKSAICLEFSDAFIALARASGIPARELEGFAQTAEKDLFLQPLSLQKDVLHAWPQYYDSSSKTWRMVDPTWSKTTGGQDFFKAFDLQHLVFAIHGLNDSDPQPAGTYQKVTLVKGDILPPRDVIVKPIDVDLDLNKKANLQILTRFPEVYISGLNSEIKIIVSNFGPVASKKQQVTIQSPNLKFSSNQQMISEIPPFGQQTVTFKLANISLADSIDDIITLNLDNSSQSFEIKIRPFYSQAHFQLIGGLLGAIVATIFTKVAWGILFQKRRR